MRYLHFAPLALILLGTMISACSPSFGTAPQREVIIVPQR